MGNNQPRRKTSFTVHLGTRSASFFFVCKMYWSITFTSIESDFDIFPWWRLLLSKVLHLIHRSFFFMWKQWGDELQVIELIAKRRYAPRTSFTTKSSFCSEVIYFNETHNKFLCVFFVVASFQRIKATNMCIYVGPVSLYLVICLTEKKTEIMHNLWALKI